MIFPAPLEPGILLKRYKRFLADIRLPNGKQITVHCPNSGAMLTCSTPGSKVYLSKSGNPKRKYPYTLEMIQEDSTWIGVNTTLTNHLVAEGILNGDIVELQNPDSLKREIKTSNSSRLDLLLAKGARDIYIEVKSCTLAVDRCAMFPDAVTARGTKHLLELADLVARGKEGVIFFLVQRADADWFRPAAHIDALYAKTLEQVHRKGVEILVYQAEVLPQEIRIVRSLPFSI
jgi:sugar fermentation stimulation protein A